MLDNKSFETLVRSNSFANHNGIRMRQVEMDKGEAKLTIGPDHLNPLGKLHGGAYYTLADCASGVACRTDGRKYVTLDGTIHFIRGAQSGTVTASATVRHRGRTTCLVEVRITGEDNKLFATGEFTFFCISGTESRGQT